MTDGPFTESKEVVGGFAILKANSKEEAIELAKDFLQGRWRRRVRTAADLRTRRGATAARTSIGRGCAEEHEHDVIGSCGRYRDTSRD